jgi:hypothetical protein
LEYEITISWVSNLHSKIGIRTGELIDYFLLVGVLTTAAFFLLEFLQYDLERTHTKKEYMLNLAYTGLLTAVAYPAIQLIHNLLPVNLLIVAVGIAACITFIEKSKSGSAISRLFWKSVLISYEKDYNTYNGTETSLQAERSSFQSGVQNGEFTLSKLREDKNKKVAVH